MPLAKSNAPGNDNKPGSEQTAQATQPGEVKPREAGVNTTSEVEVNESQNPSEQTYHDAISGQRVDKDGNFIDEKDRTVTDPSHIVADNWPEIQDPPLGTTHVDNMDAR